MSFSLSPQPLAQMQADLFSARMVGAAVGGGIVDDGPALRAAISSALALGLTLYIPPGTYRVASWDPAYSSGVIRRALNCAASTTGNQFKIVGNSATIVFDFAYSAAYTTQGLVWDATAGSFSTCGWEGITFKSANGPHTCRECVFTVGGTDTGTCNISGKNVTRVTGPNFTSDMAGQFIAMGDISSSVTTWTVNYTGTTVTRLSGPSFTADLAARTLAIYYTNFTVATFVNGNTITLTAAPSFDPSYSTSGATMLMFPGYTVASFTDAAHLVLNAPAGTKTGASWNFPRPTLGRMTSRNCTYIDFWNDIKGGGSAFFRATHSESISRHGYTADLGGYPFVSIWTNPDYLTSVHRQAQFSDWLFDGCSESPNVTYNQCRDGWGFFLGPTQTSNIRCLRNGFEATQHLYDAAQGPGTPANRALNSVHANYSIDATPPPGATAKAATGVRIDASDVTFSGFDIQGCAVGILEFGPYRPNVVCVQYRNKYTSGKITVPSSYENGVAMGTSGGGIIAVGTRSSSASDVQIYFSGDYSGFTLADGVQIGPQSQDALNCSDVHVSSSGVFAGGPKLRGFHIQQAAGTHRRTNCLVNGVDVGCSSGNPTDSADAPKVMLQGHQWQNCTVNNSGNLSNHQCDRQEILFSPNAVGWWRVATRYPLIGCDLEIYNAQSISSFNADTLVSICYEGFAGTSTPRAPFAQIRHSTYSPQITQIRASQHQDSPGRVDLDVYVPDISSTPAFPLTLVLKANSLTNMGLYDPPFQSAVLSAGCTLGATNILVTNLNGIKPGVVLQIDSELVSVFYSNAGQLQCSRGVGGTVAAAHLAGAVASIVAGDYPAYCTFTAGLHASAISLEGNGTVITGSSAGGADTTHLEAASGQQALLRVAALTNNGAGIHLVSNGGVTDGWYLDAQNNNGDFILSKVHNGTVTAAIYVSDTRMYVVGNVQCSGQFQGGLRGSDIYAALGYANFAAFADAVIASGNYTGNAALGSALGAKVGHGAALTGTANLTTGAVTGTVT